MSYRDIGAMHLVGCKMTSIYHTYMYLYLFLGVMFQAAETELRNFESRSRRNLYRRRTSLHFLSGILIYNIDKQWIVDEDIASSMKNSEMISADVVKASYYNHTWCGQVLTGRVSGKVIQSHVTNADTFKITETQTAERMILPKSRGQSVSLGKHPSESLTKNQRQKSKYSEINTGGQIHTNLLKESGDMSTPWLTANRSELFDGAASQEYTICQISRWGCLNIALLDTEDIAPECISYPKNSRTKFCSQLVKNMKQGDLQIPDRSSPQETKTDKPKDLINGIYFSEGAEGMCKVALFDSVDTGWFEHVALKDIYRMDTNGCGKGQNRLVVFGDGTRACVRYRSNIDQIQGEVYSYYLSKLLKLNNVQRPILSWIESDSRRWSRVRDLVSAAQWAKRTPFVFTKWVKNLSEAHIPQEIFGPGEKLFSGMFSGLNKTVTELCHLLQWSDLIIFDFLTGHLDRVVNMLYNSKWSPRIFSKPVHNLLASRSSGKLLFLDNESGLIHGYRALDKFAIYHKQLLRSVCLFRRSTVDAVKRLHRHGNIGQKLYELFSRHDKNYKLIPSLPDRVIQTLQQRIALVHKHIQTCATTRII